MIASGSSQNGDEMPVEPGIGCKDLEKGLAGCKLAGQCTAIAPNPAIVGIYGCSGGRRTDSAAVLLSAKFRTRAEERG